MNIRAINLAQISTRFPALASRNFRIFWAGQFVSLIGSWMQSTTQPYLAYRLTSAPIMLGLVGFAGSLPALLLMLIAGVYVERWDKRRMVLICQSIMMLQAFTLAGLALSGRITIAHIIVLAFILGSANAIEITARQAMLVELVGKQALPNAIALNSTIFNAARVLGPSLAAPFLVLLADSGEGWAFFANGVSYLFVIIGLLMMNTHSVIPEGVGQRSVFQEFAIGQRFIRSSALVSLLILMVTIPGFFGFPFVQQIPVFAREVLKTASDTQALVATRNSLMITAQGVGALVAALTLAFFSGIRRKGLFLSVGQLAFGSALVLISFARDISQALPLMALLGWGQVTSLALTNTLIQLAVPDELRGRVIGTYLWALQGVAPFGSLFLGWLVQTQGAPTAVLITGSVCLAVPLLVHLSTGTVRKMQA